MLAVSVHRQVSLIDVPIVGIATGGVPGSLVDLRGARRHPESSDQFLPLAGSPAPEDPQRRTPPQGYA